VDLDTFVGVLTRAAGSGATDDAHMVPPVKEYFAHTLNVPFHTPNMGPVPLRHHDHCPRTLHGSSLVVKWQVASNKDSCIRVGPPGSSRRQCVVGL